MAVEADLIIDWQRVAEVTRFYERHGYLPIAVPWVVEQPAYYATKPEGAVDYATVNGYLVASGEQSFMQMMDEDRLQPGCYQCATPCFRREPVFDDLHLPHFFKVELIDYFGKGEMGDRRGVFTMETYLAMSRDAMIACARTFLGRYLEVRVEETGNNSRDIVSKSGIELGSYGFRQRNGHLWIYGTGLAEPRLTQAIAKEICR